MATRRRAFLKQVSATTALVALAPPLAGTALAAADRQGVLVLVDQRWPEARSFASACMDAGCTVQPGDVLATRPSLELPAQVHTVLGLTTHSDFFICEQLLARQRWRTHYRLGHLFRGEAALHPHAPGVDDAGLRAPLSRAGRHWPLLLAAGLVGADPAAVPLGRPTPQVTQLVSWAMHREAAA